MSYIPGEPREAPVDTHFCESHKERVDGIRQDDVDHTGEIGQEPVEVEKGFMELVQ